VSQFTLFANIKKGAKPDFHKAGKGEASQVIYDKVLKAIEEELGPGRVHDGVFGAMMGVALVNDGPVTIQYDTKHSHKSTNPLEM
jgi:D-tyrosyl-tRNA(Tyr) deacylase